MPDEGEKIRIAREEDLPAIHDLEIENFDTPWTLNSYVQELMTPHSKILLLESKSRISGFIVYRIFLQELEIFKICCKKEQRRKGIAARLLKQALRNAENKADTVFLEVAENNLEAVSFYKKHGFKEIGIRKNYYGQGRDALNMKKVLPGGLNDN